MADAAAPFTVGLDAREAFRLHPRGIGLYARHLMREFGALCPDVPFLLYHERDLPADMPPIPPRMRPVQARIRGGRVHAWERALMPLRLWRDRPTVYHGTYNTLPPRLPLLRRTPMVVTLHDVIVTWYEDDLRDPYVRYCRAVTPRVVRDAAVILTVSEWSRRDIVERFGVPPEKVRVFYNGVHPDFLHGAPAGAGAGARQRFAGGEPYVFAVGARLARKNTAALLQALAQLHRSRRLGPRVVVCGLEGEQAAPFTQLARELGLAEHVSFLGYVTRADLVALYAGAELFVYPSLLEGWGIPVIEALALGTPVVTSHTSGMLEAGGDHATYFEPTSVDSIATAIADALARREQFAAVRDAAIARARSFTWRRAAEVTLQAYRDAAQ